jgi:hypothetical protein
MIFLGLAYGGFNMSRMHFISKMAKTIIAALIFAQTAVFVFPMDQAQASTGSIAKYDFQTDLNGDKKKDSISIQYNHTAETVKITINGKSISYDNFFLGSPQELTVKEYLKSQTGIIDLNKKDKFREILINIRYDFGIPDNVLVCYDKAPQKMGRYKKLSFDGNGVITENKLSHFPGNYFYSKIYKLDGKHQLEEIKSDYYKAGDAYTLTAKKHIDILDKDKVTAIGAIEPDEEVKFLGGDDQQWMVLEKNDGSIGWVNIPVPGKVQDFFDGLENMRIYF